MLTVDNIALMCMGKNTFSRGQLIYKVKNVKELKVWEEQIPHRYHIKGVVKGSNVEDYNVEAIVDERDSRVSNISCSCLAYQSYTGLCKHCVAMLMEYVDRRDGMEVQGLPVATRCTDMGFVYILEQFSNQKNVEYLQPEWLGRVSLVPEVSCSMMEELEVSFRIGATSLYVVKNLREFVQEVKNAQRVRYGKNLDFYNVASAYTEESREILQFILACEEDELSGGHSYGRYAYQASQKSIRLRQSKLDEFMRLMLNQHILFTDGRQEKRKVFVKDGVPKKPMRIKGEEDGIMIYTEHRRIWYGRNYAYIMEDDVIYRTDRFACEAVESFAKWANLYGPGGIFVANPEVAMFVRNMLPDIEKLYPVEMEDFERNSYEVQKGEFKIYLDAPQPNMITCKVMACYGNGEEYNIFQPGLSELNRDMQSELLLASKISSMFDTFDPEQYLQVVSDEENIYRLLTEGIGILQAFGEVFVSDELKKINVRGTPQMQFGISLTSSLLEIDISGEQLSLEELANILSRYDRRKKYYRLKNGDFIRMNDEEEIAKIARMTKALQLKPEEVLTGKVRVPKYRALYLDERMQEFSAIQYECNSAFRKLVENVREMDGMKEPVPQEMDEVLREYQKEGYYWLMSLKKHGFGAVLADDMGLGKTLQTIAVLLSSHRKGVEHPSLIVCPASLIYNWNAEISRFAPELHTVMITGNAAARQGLIENIAPGDIVITSYDLMKRDVEFYEEHFFECQVIDEAQYIKNHNTQVAKAVKLIRADFKVALTGTPVENRLSELWSIFDYIMPGFLYTYNKFREDIEAPIALQDDKLTLENLQRMIAPFVLRRLKKDVLKFLPDKIEKNMYAQMDGEQRELYKAHVQRMRMILDKQSEAEFRKGKIQVLAELTKLRQICCNPALIFNEYKGQSAKTQMCIELIKNAIDGGHRILLFSQFTAMLEMLQDELEREHIRFLTLTGSTSKERRAALVEEFNEGRIPVFCISLKAGGTGLNLTAADIVIHYDPWWNVAVENQATDRAHRIGQDKVVTVYKLIAKDSIEEGIVELQEKKRELADEILASDSISTAQISKEQLLELLG